MIDVQRLRVFRAVVASGSVQAAADHLGYTPSAVSQHLTALQRETGLVLFEKAGRGIAPTPTARVLAAESDEVMGSLSRLGGVVDQLREGRSGSLTIGTFDSAAEFWLPHVARGLQREFPDVILELSLGELSAAGTAPIRPDIEMVNEAIDDPGTTRAGYSRQVLAEEGYSVLVPSGHELLTRYAGPIPLSALAGVGVIDNDLNHGLCFQIIETACRAAGFSQRYVARTANHHTALAFVASGVGVTLLPDLARPEAMPGVESRTLINPTPQRRIVLQVRDGAATTPPVVRALELLREAVAATAARRVAG